MTTIAPLSASYTPPQAKPVPAPVAKASDGDSAAVEARENAATRASEKANGGFNKLV